MFIKYLNPKTSIVLAALLSYPTLANAAPLVNLGIASTYSVLAETFSNSNTAAQTIINGNVGCTTCNIPLPQTITGNGGLPFTPKPPQAGVDQGIALTDLNNAGTHPCKTTTAVVDIAALVQPLTPGVYCFTGAVSQAVNTTVTLSGSGLYIFRIAGALTTGANDVISLTGGAQAGDIFWVPTGATTIGANNNFVGTIIDDAGISLGHFTTLLGRALAFATTVTTDANTITAPTTLRIIKDVINDNGGTSTAASFSLHAKLGGVDVTGSPAVGVSSPGRAYTLAASTYAISEDLNNLYAATFSGDCDASDNITLAAGADKTCTITNNDVVPPPLGAVTLVKSLGLPAINAGGVSTLTITLSNNNVGPASLTSALVDTLPNGMVIAPTPNVSTTCGGTPTAVAGGNTVTLNAAGSSIPGGSPGTCSITVSVTAPLGGSYINTLAAGTLVTSNGNNIHQPVGYQSKGVWVIDTLDYQDDSICSYSYKFSSLLPV